MNNYHFDRDCRLYTLTNFYIIFAGFICFSSASGDSYSRLRLVGQLIIVGCSVNSDFQSQPPGNLLDHYSHLVNYAGQDSLRITNFSWLCLWQLQPYILVFGKTAWLYLWLSIYGKCMAFPYWGNAWGGYFKGSTIMIQQHKIQCITSSITCMWSCVRKIQHSRACLKVVLWHPTQIPADLQ